MDLPLSSALSSPSPLPSSVPVASLLPPFTAPVLPLTVTIIIFAPSSISVLFPTLWGQRGKWQGEKVGGHMPVHQCPFIQWDIAMDKSLQRPTLYGVFATCYVLKLDADGVRSRGSPTKRSRGKSQHHMGACKNMQAGWCPLKLSQSQPTGVKGVKS